MKIEVAVYHLGQIDLDEGFQRYHDSLNDSLVHVKWLGVTELVADAEPWERLCARAWVECVGKLRLKELVELGAPECCKRAQTDIDVIAAAVKRAPTPLRGLCSYLYDNEIEAWLIVPDVRGECPHYIELRQTRWALQCDKKEFLRYPSLGVDRPLARSLFEPGMN